MKRDMIFLAIVAFVLAVAASLIGGCALRAATQTTPVVTSRVLSTSGVTTVNGQEYDDKFVTCPARGDCQVVVPFTDTTTVKLPRLKRGCLGTIALGGLAGTAGGAAWGSIRYPNDVAVSSDRVDVWFDATWKYATIGGAAFALFTGALCYATRYGGTERKKR